MSQDIKLHWPYVNGPRVIIIFAVDVYQTYALGYDIEILYMFFVDM